jgi:hypothetical protein
MGRRASQPPCATLAQGKLRMGHPTVRNSWFARARAAGWDGFEVRPYNGHGSGKPTLAKTARMRHLPYVRVREHAVCSEKAQSMVRATERVMEGT